MRLLRPRLSIPFAAALLYFSEGLPYGLITELAPIYLRVHGVSLAEIALLSTVGLVWTLKLFWAPLVDLYGTYRRWIAVALAGLVSTLAALGLIGEPQGRSFWILITILALASATQDIAIDAFTISATPPRLVGPVNSIRLAAYRVGIILSGGGLAALASRTSWGTAFAAAAILTCLILLATPFLPAENRSAVRGTHILRNVRASLNRTNGGRVLGVVLLYKLGDRALAPMIKPFWIDRGYSAAEVGTVTTVIGVAFTILGAIIAGWFVRRYGIVWSLLWMGVIQVLSNGGYALVSSLDGGRAAIYMAAVIESFSEGLGATAFLSYLMSICNKENAATEYALLTALFGLMRSLAGSFSGIGAQSLGYTQYFWLTVLLGLPGLLLVWSSRKLIEDVFRQGGGDGAQVQT
ncbi:MAG TPA: MFS transporter [Thermoanaerobaculia bacterium]|nr:MFS transporter [Thermoanaerobaculia bacterium]